MAVKSTRNITKRDMVHNDYLPVMEVDSQTYEVRADGMLLTCEPAKVLPLAQRYFLFNVVGVGRNCGLRTRVGEKQL